MNEWADRNIMVGGGDFMVSDNSDLTFCTVLGSCIAICIYDPVAGIGGMNHYLLPHNPGEFMNARYGDDASFLLLRQLRCQGAMPKRLVAKVFGGARILASDVDIGQANIDLAEAFLHENRIPVVDSDVGGRSARWIAFQPAGGGSFVRHTVIRSVYQHDMSEVALPRSQPITADLTRK